MRVKICGITNLEDGRVAVAAGADLLGFILYPKSPRFVTPEQAAAIVAALRAELDETQRAGAPPRFVGVFVNEAPARVAEVLVQTGFDYAQLHGDEPVDQLDALAGRAYKALRPANAAQAQEDAARFARSTPLDGPRLLIDAYAPNEYGGTGTRADWHAAALLAQRYPGLLLAGGLTPTNVEAAVRQVQPWGVDVSSGVEAAPGKKEPDRVREFVALAKGRA